MLIDINNLVEFIRIKRECASYEQKVREKYENDYRNYIECSLSEKQFYRTQVSLGEIAIKTLEFYKEKLKVAYRNSDFKLLFLEYVYPRTMEDLIEGEPPKLHWYVLGSGEDFDKPKAYCADHVLDVTPYIGYPDFYNSFPEVIRQIEDVIIELAEQRVGLISLEELKNRIINVLDSKKEERKREKPGDKK